MLNLFVEFRFELFNMKTLFDFKLRISAGMIENLKTRNITLIPTTFRSTKMFKTVGSFSASKDCRDKCDISYIKILDHASTYSQLKIKESFQIEQLKPELNK